MAQIYGELIRAQLQVSASNLSSAVPGLIYLNSGDKKPTVYDGTSWQKLVNEAALQDLSALPIITPAKGGLGANASAWTGVVKAASGVFSAATIVNADVSATAAIDYSKLSVPDGAIAQSKVASLTTDLSNKVTANGAIVGATKTKITYDTKGLVTAGADLTASDLPLITPSKGGTGVANNDAATLTRSGNHDLSLTTTAATSLTLPTTGTVAVLADITSANFSGILASTKGGTGVNNAGTLTYGANNITLTTSGATGVTLPTSGTLATTAGSETLTNKTLQSDLVDNYLDITQETAGDITSFGNPGAGKLRLYARQDGKLYKKDPTGSESEIGGSGTGTGRNYLQDWFDGSKLIGTVLTGLTSTGNRSVSGGADAQWGASSTSNMTVALETTTPLRQTSSIKIDSLNTTSGAFVETPLFYLDNADLGKPLSIEFDIGDVALSTSYDIVVMQYALNGTYEQTISVAGNASTGSPASAQLPTGTTKFRGFFIPAGDASHYYSLRIRKLAAVDDDFTIDSLFVGPQSLAQGAVVTQWQSYTPTVSGFGSKTITSTLFRYRRVGSNMEIMFQLIGNSVASGTGSTEISFSLPSTLTVDSTIAPAGDYSNFGAIQTWGITSNGIYDYTTLATPTTAYTGIRFIKPNANAVYVTTDLNIARSVQFEGLISLPISQWSSGTTTLADRAVEEYAASTTGTWDAAAAATDTVRGIDGAPITGALSAVRLKVVRFSTPILPTDNLFLELYGINGVAGWTRHSDCGLGITQQLTQTYGAQLNVGYGGIATDVAVYFSQYSQVYNSTYGGAGLSWAGAATKWRVRKVSGGASVGFPVSARNIVGDTSGTAVPSGYVGELITNGGTNTAVTPSGSSNIQTLTSISLTSGIWDISGTATFSPGSISNLLYIAIGISKTNNAFDVANAEALTQIVPGAGTTGTILPTPVRRIVVTSTTTIYLVGQVGYSTVGSAVWNANATFLRATRIA